MKTLLSILFFVSIATLTFSQTIASASIMPPLMETTTPEISEAQIKRIAQKQNEIVINQLQAYLAESVEYSDLMAENSIEGEVIVQVNISDYGRITKNRIIQSPNEIASDLVLKVMEDFTEVAIAESIYYGHKKIRIPVNFSIR